MGKKKIKHPLWERIMWWCSVVGSIIVLGAAVPAMPWRYSRVDTNCGNRYVMERYYFLTGFTNHIGKTEGWMSIRRKVQRKTEEFGRPSPLVAMAGVATQSLGAGGAAMGCVMWMVCKEHTSNRYMQYTTIAYSSFAMIAAAVCAPACSAGFCVYLGFEQDQREKGKKKKKKKDDECLDLPCKAAMFAVFAFLFSLGMTAGFEILIWLMFDAFKNTAYYPYAGAFMAVWVAAVGCLLLFITACTSIYRCCSKKPREGEGAGEWEWGGEWEGEGAWGEGGGYGGKGYSAGGSSARQEAVQW